MAKQAYYVHAYPPKDNFAGHYVIINGRTLSPTGDGPWPLSPEGELAALRCLSSITAEPIEQRLMDIVHANGNVTKIFRSVTPTGFLYRLSGKSADGRRLSAKDFTSYEAAASYAEGGRPRGQSARIMAPQGWGPKFRPRSTLAEIEHRRREAKSL